MTYTQSTILAQISAPKLRAICDIPNAVGFKLRLIKRTNMGDAHVPCVVQKDKTGCHICVDLKGSHRLCTAFDGWLPNHS